VVQSFRTRGRCCWPFTLRIFHSQQLAGYERRTETILDGYPWLEPEDIQTCLVYAHRIVAHERVDLTCDEQPIEEARDLPLCD
jgi:hypothetical protein